MQLTVALFSSQKYEHASFDACLNNQTRIKLTRFEQSLDAKSAILSQGFDAVCVFVNDIVDKTVIDQLAQFGVKCILLRCAGFNNVDLAAAHAHNIKVCRVPAYSPEAVAEHCVALMLTLNRKTHKAYNRIREDNFDLNGLLGFNLFKKTIGIIGCGKIGLALVNILNGFGANVLVCDPYAVPGNYTICDLDTLLSQSDVISLHCPLTEQTHHMINEHAFAKMKQGVMLINTSRGALVDSKACIGALKTKKLGYLGLDVYEQESELFFKDRSDEIMQDDVFSRLVSFPNVLVTGHQGFFTKEALSEIAQITVNNALEFANNQPLSNEVK
ncbi:MULTISPECIES: 2-hydroxyacid dehydrogenase [Pseudoalteromonas]|uniref:2-hydroxyacid dehydrogenase n=1 Tax=Pseudoalteromonas TaxID=53246 RepID=UPI0012312BEA|nr:MULTISPECIES: 2-hydroxyacid dehydrogenase [Pseudoalteromonas]MBB1309910.1 2-hydroxyacid dehydrogenase [Pseudoalteromonas sp. SR41-8]MBB1396682.1 2-hydroxyacid dehydrogenase [Pseudoalteromonas sp. SG44-8]MBB1411417.1 2-hydroxyacid dehydrogenase [Pseudoalteromonas sp. SG44-17]MBB1436697.1 2-hydroxyacid dehydrogenase [Pseudoalteromonas sp. SG43-6]MBB1481255.1 2-hydroxyacid dehydrogenase [Pseudoalteromonas sp. SG41-2]|tara:strand:+ start:7600 stop:8586 length:987 start_codon:yes stop_codon:yes gene_type:complete